MRNTYIILLICVSFCIEAAAQNVSESFSALSKSYGDSIVLRWVPVDYYTWQEYSEGFIIERTTVNQPGEVMIDSVKIWEEIQWKQYFEQNQSDDIATKYLGIAAQMCYGKNLETTFSNSLSAEAINMASSQELRHSYAMLSADLSVPAANALGLRYCDKKVEIGKSYLYKIYPIALYGKPSRSNFFNAYAHCTKDGEVQQPPKLVIEEGDHLIHLKVDLQLYQNQYTAFLIERSEKETTGFEVITKTPIIILNENSKNEHEFSYYDVIDRNGQNLYYRLIGIDAFADLSPPSEPSGGMGLDKTLDENPTIVSIVGEKNKGVQLEWTMDEVDDLAGFWVGQSTHANGPFRLCNREMLPKGQRTYTDTLPDPSDKNFYHILAVDEAGNMSVSQVRYAAIVDKEPPSVPQNLKATADSTGWVLLRWDAVKDEDIHGYHVFYTNDTTHAYSVLTGQLSSANYFLDSISTQAMNKYIYYKVCSVDQNYNRSDFSKVLQVRRFHDFKLQAPVISDIKINEQNVILTWKKSSHPLADGYKVFVQPEGSKKWKLYQTIDDTNLTYCTLKLEEGNYRFSLKAVSEFAQESPFALAISMDVPSSK
ncbi:MAG: hypothetical protein KJP00_10825, partial [Bacteroidia bacterium]|nr:hypothetical protein [Bacteroidia bacterium]